MDILCCELSNVLLFLCGISLLIYLYGKWRNTVFYNTGIPGPTPDIYIGNLRLLFQLGFGDLDSELRKRYGDVYGIYVGGFPSVIVFDLDMVKEIFVKNFQNFIDRMVLDFNPYPVSKGLFFERGATWQRLRNILSPTFTGGKLRQMCHHMNTASRTLSTNLVKAAEKGSIIDVKEYFGGYSMDTIASTAFGIQTDSQQNPDNPFVGNAKKLFTINFFQQPFVFLALIFPSVAPILRTLGVYTFPKDSVQFFVRIVETMIEERKQQSDKNKDFLDLLMNAEVTTDEDGNALGSEEKKHKRMTTTEIFAQAFLFFAGGYETTATTLQFTSYSLATNPQVQEKLIDEIDSVLGDEEPTYDNVQTLEYLDHVMKENLRLYPAVPAVVRQAAETITIKGYTIPKGCYVSLQTLQIHRDPKLYPEPKKFNPDRWNDKERNPASYVPFGIGPRQCLGMRLALIEMKIALIHILRKVKFVRLPDTPDEMEFKNGATVLTPKTPIKLGVKLR